MGRAKGGKNKDTAPASYALTEEQRLELIARLLVEIICGEQNEANGS